MGQLIIRKLEDEVISRLKARARASGSSLEEFARETLRAAVKPSASEILAEVDRIRSMGRPTDCDSTATIREARDRGWRGD
jgi:plasmid stability protein